MKNLTPSKNSVVSPELSKRAITWLLQDDTGISSKTMIAAMFNVDIKEVGGGIPHDPSDFGRCYRLIKAIPEVVSGFPNLISQYPEWAPYIENWDRLTSLYERDLKSRISSELLRVMRSFRETNIEECNSAFVFSLDSEDGLKNFGQLASQHKAQEFFFSKIPKDQRNKPFCMVAIPSAILNNYPDSTYLKYPRTLHLGTFGNAVAHRIIVGHYPLEIDLGAATIKISGALNATVIQNKATTPAHTNVGDLPKNTRPRP